MFRAENITQPSVHVRTIQLHSFTILEAVRTVQRNTSNCEAIVFLGNNVIATLVPSNGERKERVCNNTESVLSSPLRMKILSTILCKSSNMKFRKTYCFPVNEPWRNARSIRAQRVRRKTR